MSTERRRGTVRAGHESGLSRLSLATSHCFYVFTNHGFFWPFPFTGRQTFLLERTRPPNHGFHESRVTSHESRTLSPPGRCFPARCGAAWGGYGAAWAAAVPRTGNTACMVFTNHGFLAFSVHRPSDISSGANQASTNGFHETRDTRHESRLICFSRDTKHGSYGGTENRNPPSEPPCLPPSHDFDANLDEVIPRYSGFLAA